MSQPEYSKTVSSVHSNIYLGVRSTCLSASHDFNRYEFGYEIEIENQSDRVVQLLSRYWLITNAEGQQEEVSGQGVIGLQPIFKPGQSFSYTSWVMLDSPSGQMCGRYTMLELDSGHIFEVALPNLDLRCLQAFN